MENSKGKLEGRVALVTGGGRGIGRQIAVTLALHGAQVAVCGRQVKDLQSVRDEITSNSSISGKCISISCDVTDEAAVAKLVSEVEQTLGSVEILINNAGIYKTEPLLNHKTAIWQETLATNLTGAFFVTRAVLQKMIDKKWGRIINISSISGRSGEIWGSAYSASKFGMIGLTQSLALEVAGSGITANAVCPGWVKGELASGQLNDPNWCKLNSMPEEESVSNAMAATPIGRFIEPAEVAQLVVYLASDEAAAITGQSINICGGLSLH